MERASNRARVGVALAMLASGVALAACGSGGSARRPVSASERALAAGLRHHRIVLTPRHAESGPIRPEDAPGAVRARMSSLTNAYPTHTAMFLGTIPEVSVGRSGHRHVRLAIEARGAVHPSAPFERPVYVIWVDESSCREYPFATCFSANRGSAELVGGDGRILGTVGMPIGGLAVADVAPSEFSGRAYSSWLAALASHGVDFSPLAVAPRPAGVISPDRARAAALFADSRANLGAHAAPYLGRSSEADGLIYLVRIVGVKQQPVSVGKVNNNPKTNHEVNVFIDAHTGKFISDASFR